MDLVLLIVATVAVLAVLGQAVIDYRLRERDRQVQLDLRCQDVIRDFQRRKP
jgi:hypothetical protein